MKRWLLMCACLACAPASSGPAPQSKEPPPAQAKEQAAVPPPSGGTPIEPADPSFAVIEKICAAPCAGDFARLTVFRTADGKVGVVRFDGDLQACSHPPRVYFDADGNETLAIPERPVAPGSEEAKRFAAQQEAAVAGMKEAETLGCPDKARCEPTRTEGFHSNFPCRTDEDCVDCQCMPVNRPEWTRRGGSDACTDADAECMATNPACCAGVCVLAR